MAKKEKKEKVKKVKEACAEEGVEEEFRRGTRA